MQDVANCAMDYGPIHLVMLRGLENLTTSSDQKQWLRQDLAASTAPWKMLCIRSSAELSSDSEQLDSLHRLLDECGVDVCMMGGQRFSHTRRGNVIYISVGPGPDQPHRGTLLGIQVEAETLACELFNGEGEQGSQIHFLR